MINENDFTTHAGPTLHPKSMDHDDLQIIDAAIKRMMELNGDQRNRHFSTVQKMLDAAATGTGRFGALLHEPYRNGAGVSGHARHPTTTKEEFVDADGDFDLVKYDNALSDNLDAMGMNEETRQRAAELFFEAVEARLFHEDDEFRQQLYELLEDCVPSPFISNEDLDIVEILANRVADLEDALEYVESENEALEEEIRAEVDDYKADLQQHEALNFRSPKKSSINEWMLESDESNADALFNEDREAHVGDLEMRAYLNAYRKEEF